MQNTKIIHILCGKANPKTTMNGVNVVVDRYASMLFERGYDVEVWGIANNPHTNLPSPQYPIRFFQQYRSWPCRLDGGLVESIRCLDCASTVLHFHGAFLKEFPKIVGLLKGVSYFVMPHGGYSEFCVERRNRLKKQIYHLLRERQFLNGSRGVFLFSDELAAMIAHSLVVPRILLSKEPDPLFQDNGGRTGRSVGNGSGVVWGYCGRIDNELKALDTFIRAFLLFRRERKGERHKVSVVGDGPDLPLMRHCFKREIDEGLVEFHGSLFGRAKLQKYMEMDYFEHVSNTDCKPLACIDAMALGIPVLVTPATGLAEEVEEFGAGEITANTEKEIVRAMHALLERDRGAMSQACRRLIAENYSYQGNISRLVESYESTLTHGKA